MGEHSKKQIGTILKYAILIIVGFIMVYPLIWMVGATFKTNQEIFTNMTPFTAHPSLDGYRNSMNDYGGKINLLKAMLNTYSYVIPKVLFTVVSCTITAYGFGRFNFVGKNVLFAVLMSTLFLPNVVMNVPQYILYNNFGWIDSKIYLPLVIPSLFAFDTYFVFMMIQFLRNIPKELDEAATIDGCNSIQTLWHVICPMLKPAMVSCALFQFMWSSNDFMGPLLYVKTVERYPATIFVKLSMDADTGFEWNRVLAVSVISIIPQLVVFFCAQDQFIDGISAGSVKG
ncbi:MAG: carbohydrate ABC transporter permease [Oscillospiraceae bacterium]|nr:carbohydrate ABC transporter permease [Oscillospiraceae bacterium]MBQ8978162.1 carbohydrate ABC transporter permease [Oscillospiraceae bacterium]